ncbi:response regulator receiver, CheY-like protein (plasmid) [Acaryochloris marina MBIC11017]|uniref:Response regulator receiver, CheY-like protein n=1 Tax=Acaryochloris marina (strain MBIC 11017) TaxID=329726 RepID=A8ZN93_ACAM1|nr:response regulator receiver, CheY-like protein [Acaryochloris marina MBIC11017]
MVDDQPNIMNLLTSIMEQDEYEVWQASSGAEGLQMAAKVLPDLILLDVNMPDMDGYTVCQQLKADPQTTAIPIIFVSALDETWDKVKGFSVGGSDYITKPFNTLEVIVRIEDQLKIRQIQDQMLKADQAPTDSPQSKPSSAKAVILMADDEPKNLALLTDVLEQEGYEIWQADSGAEALRVAGMVLPDLILLDINMPDMQGYDVCQQLKANAKTKLIPVIFVSALDETWDKVKAFSVGGSDYITKPFNTLEVIVRIENQLEIRQIQDQMLKADQAPTDSPQPTPSSAKAVILMVDDEPKNLALLTDVLEHDGYEIWQADSGSEALRVAGMVLPDLILLDINMPDMQGYDVCQQLKANAKTKLIPVIFVSALDETWDKVKAFSVGGSDYINKPIQIVELMARMKHQLQIWH